MVSVGAVCADAPRCGIGEGEIAEFDLAANLTAVERTRLSVVDGSLGMEDIVQPAHGRGAAFENIGHPTQGNHRESQQSKKLLKRNEVA